MEQSETKRKLRNHSWGIVLDLSGNTHFDNDEEEEESKKCGVWDAVGLVDRFQQPENFGIEILDLSKDFFLVGFEAAPKKERNMGSVKYKPAFNIVCINFLLSFSARISHILGYCNQAWKYTSLHHCKLLRLQIGQWSYHRFITHLLFIYLCTETWIFSAPVVSVEKTPKKSPKLFLERWERERYFIKWDSSNCIMNTLWQCNHAVCLLQNLWCWLLHSNVNTFFPPTICPTPFNSIQWFKLTKTPKIHTHTRGKKKKKRENPTHKP